MTAPTPRGFTMSEIGMGRPGEPDFEEWEPTDEEVDMLVYLREHGACPCGFSVTSFGWDDDADEHVVAECEDLREALEVNNG